MGITQALNTWRPPEGTENRKVYLLNVEAKEAIAMSLVVVGITSFRDGHSGARLRL